MHAKHLLHLLHSNLLDLLYLLLADNLLHGSSKTVGEAIIRLKGEAAVQDGHGAPFRATRGVLELAEKVGCDGTGVDVQPCSIAGIRHEDYLHPIPSVSMVLGERGDKGDEIGFIVGYFLHVPHVPQRLAETVAQERLSLSSEFEKVDINKLCELSTRGL